MLTIELKNIQVKLDQETSAHEEAVASFNADKKRSTENHNIESLQGLHLLIFSLFIIQTIYYWFLLN
jgi:hypothetical protein